LIRLAPPLNAISHSFAKTPLNEAHAPEAMAIGCHGIELLGSGIIGRVLL
jgi:hypothetical protein